MPLKKLVYILLFLMLLSAWGCKKKAPSQFQSQTTESKELLIYCENSMVAPLLELKETFEKKHDCIVRIQNDCSQNLIGLLNYSQRGDLFIPASGSAFSSLASKTDFHLTDTVFLGYNHLVYMVKKGNPLNFNGHLNTLLKSAYPIIIANPATSSLGYETKQVLTDKKIYDKILKNVVALTSDSKGLVKSLQNNQADIVINWATTYFINGNKNHIDIIRPLSAFDEPIPVYAASLSCSQEPTLAREFLNLATSVSGENALRKYGFSKRKPIIF